VFLKNNLTNKSVGISPEMLTVTGYGDTPCEAYAPREIVLRDGRKTLLWVHERTGHGILDPQYWEASSFYEQAYREEHGPKPGELTGQSKCLEIYRELNDRQFAEFSDLINDRTRFLEIGCSFGGILSRVAARGPAVSHAVEPNTRDARFVKKQVPAAEIYNCTFERAALQKGYYNLVASLEVLEHTVSPLAFLEKCAALMEPGGALFLEVPNHADVLLGIYREKAYRNFYYHKAHIHYFTAASLHGLCKKCGFAGQVESFVMYSLFNHLWWLQHHGPQPSAAKALSGLKPARGKGDAPRAINRFFEKVEKEYVDLLNAHEVGDCLIYRGRKRDIR